MPRMLKGQTATEHTSLNAKHAALPRRQFNRALLTPILLPSSIFNTLICSNAFVVYIYQRAAVQLTLVNLLRSEKDYRGWEWSGEEKGQYFLFFRDYDLREVAV